MSAEENKAIARRMFGELWNQGKLEVANEIFGANYIFHEPVAGEVRGPEGFKEFVSMYRTALPDLQFTIEDQVAEGNKVVTRWTATGTHKGELMGIQPTGVKVRVTGMGIACIAGGMIVEFWDNYDALGLLQQLGVVSPLKQVQ